MVDEAEHSLSDALSVLSQTVRDACIVLDGGCSEMLMSRAVDETARKAKGKKAIPMEAFAHALRQIPTIVTDNAGDDSSDLVTCLRAAQYKGQTAPAWVRARYPCVMRNMLLTMTRDLNGELPVQ